MRRVNELTSSALTQYLNNKKGDLPIFNVTGYGAYGDNSHDDTSFINDAAEDCGSKGGGLLYFPPGNYLANNLMIPYNCVIVGCGRNNTQILKNGNGNLITITGSDQTNTPRYSGMRHILLNGNKGQGYTGSGIYADRMTGWQFLEVEVKNFDKAYNLDAPWDCTFLNCWFRGNDYGYFDKNTATEVSNNSRFIGCHLENNGSHIHSDSSYGPGRNYQHYLIGSKIEVQTNNTRPGAVYFDADQVTVSANYFYLSENVPLIAFKGKSNRLVGCTFSTPKESYVVTLEGNDNITSDNVMRTGSNSFEYVRIISGTGNKNAFTAVDGGSQAFIRDDSGTTANFSDVISQGGARRRFRGNFDMNVRDVVAKTGHTAGDTPQMNAGVNLIDITFTENQDDNNYIVYFSPSWTTAWGVTNRTASGFRVNFGTPVPTNGTVASWFIVRKGL